MKEIGHKIKNMREALSMSVREVAERAGVSDTALGQIEAGTIGVPVSTLLKIAGALRVDIGHFFQHEEGEDEIEIVRSEDRRTVEHPGRQSRHPIGYSYEALSTRKTKRHMQPFLVEFDLELGESVPMVDHPGEEFLYLLEGELEFRTPEEVRHLVAGDSLYFRSTTPHAFSGVGRNRPKAIVVIYTG